MSMKDIKEILVAMGKNYTSIHMYFLKHLNRYGKVHMDIPIWRNNKWETDKIMYIQEVPKGSFINKEFQIKNGVKLELIKNTYTLLFNIVDNDTKINIRSGLAETRNDVFKEYEKFIRNAYELHMIQTGNVM